MALKHPVLRIIYLLLFTCTAYNAVAQPTLPDIAGAADKGIVILSWNCQYTGIKSITVLRSADSISYSPIGKVKKLDKGIQAFVDGHPAPGRNYYKLIILFKSALTWSSNHCSVEIERAVLERSPLHLPPNDSLQRYIMTSDTAKAGRISTVTQPVSKPKVKDNLSVEPEDDSDAPPPTAKKTNDPDDDDQEGTNKPIENKKKTFISFDLDTITYKVGNSKPTEQSKPVEHKKVIMSFDDPMETTPTFIRSLYIYIDTPSGHVSMNLPPDVATHHYSVKFYNEQNQMVTEVPKITATKAIIDKRNFQRKGTFRFVLRKDVTELESGYIEIK